MTILALTQANFDVTIQQNDCVVVDFWANWCQPCLDFKPTLDKISARHPDIIVATVDIDQEPQLAQDFNVRSIPLLMIFRREFAVCHHAGVLTAESLDKLIVQAKKIDLLKLRAQVKK